ncbi:GNAT family N-acetyltransferase [Flavilitoribacter nigricans]|uniref:BioF2-like acetyltransferase domain-containing protein n=1 Tax=Flavilitoribacter nigricans (strain ATCC 23147 / DSM 23189 / NBRC 102662 / NCIMB 1420 / SS-2) TaxID=1122177 RepID=A0A2D0N6T6_FLAN2|nr:GNAT family N-acetyltransferase [Flavilitoribacter nigricans]PHN03493.1 hypothetical protein CRP01_26185 [Flavilitoribacter nigricans DSM 23189 = NBRC 102662]
MSNRDAYRSFCREIPDLPVFMEPWYLDAARNGESWDAALVRDGDCTVAALPYFTKKQYIFNVITQPVFVKHLGPILHPDRRDLSDQHKYYRQLIEQLPTVDCFKQHFHPGVSNWLPFYWQGYRQTLRYTYRLDISDLDQVWSGITGNKRREIAKAEKLLQLRHDLPLEALYRVNKMSFDRQQIAIPYSLDQLSRLDRALDEHQSRQLFFAVDDSGNIHSVAFLIWDRQRAYFHLAGDDPALRKSYGGFWLIWQCIRYAHLSLGLREFDFAGSMLPEVEPIRRRFGAHQVPYSFVWKYHSGLYAGLDWMKERLGI